MTRSSILVYGEVTEYLLSHSKPTERQDQLRRLLRTIYPYYLTPNIMERYAVLRRRMRAPYGEGLIGDVDTLIAATALVRDLTVVTSDARHFPRVPGLNVLLVDLQTRP